MARYLPQTVGGVSLGEWTPRCVQYLTTVMEAQQKDMGLRNKRELRTLAEAIDALLLGDNLRATDILAARFSAVEMSSHEGSWSVSSHLELIPQTSASTASTRAMRAAAREAADAAKLQRLMGSGGGKKPWGKKHAD
jgi:hypothetical protein